MRRLTSLFVALLLGSAAGVVLATGPASAAACAKGVGVTVVVGGSVSCDSNGGGDAASNFQDVGHSLTYVDTQPGFVCQVDSVPDMSCARTPPANKYWGLFWSDGTSGTWKYSSLGAGSLNVPRGGWVAFVFQTSNSKTYPSMKPLAATPKPAPEPTAKPTNKPGPKATSKPRPGTTSMAPVPSATSIAPTPTASSATPTPSASTKAPEPTATPTAEPSEGAVATPEEAEIAKTSATKDDSGSGGLGWVAGGIGVLLIAGMGMTLWRRKAAGGQS